jgi:SpoVK/Ycf46/Vps4 family AAA+-type ATPase
VGGTSGESEERIRQIFESAAASAPSVLFIDGIDVIAGKKDVSLGCTINVVPSYYYF